MGWPPGVRLARDVSTECLPKLSDTKTNTENELSFVFWSPTASIMEIYEMVMALATRDPELEANKKRSMVRVYTHSGFKCATWIWNEVKCQKDFTKLCLSRRCQAETLGLIENFLESSAWYKRRGLEHKIGFFLYGPPGTGKTSLVQVVANEYGLPVYKLNLKSLNSESDLRGMIHAIDSGLNKYHCYILLIEDIDWYLDPDSDLKGTAKGGGTASTGIPVNEFLDLLDGMECGDGRILFVSSNNPRIFDRFDREAHDQEFETSLSHLHSKGKEDDKTVTENAVKKNPQMISEKGRTINAFVRPGRIDHKIEIGYCDRDQCRDLFRLYYAPRGEEDDAPANLEDILQNIPELPGSSPFTPAELIHEFLRYPREAERVLNWVKSPNFNKIR